MSTTALDFETIELHSMTFSMTFLPRTLLTVLLFSGFLISQTKPAPTAKPAMPPAPKLTVRPDPVATVLPTEETMNSFLFQMVGYDSTKTWKITEIRPSEVPGLAEVLFVITSPQGSGLNRLLVSSDGKHAISGEVLPFGAKPFDDAWEKLEKGINGPAKGPEKAPVLIVEFSDMQCPHCQKAAPIVDQLLAQEPDAHFVFQNFPLPSHNWAEKGAAYVDCVGKASNDAVWKFIQKTFDEQNNITESNADEKLKAIASALGVNGDEIAACAAKPETKARIEASVAMGKAVGVTGTPSLFINGQSLPPEAGVEVLKKVVDFKFSLEKTGK